MLRYKNAPQPDVSVQQQSHQRSASQSLSSLAGETMSPTMRPVPAKEPSQSCDFGSGGGGTTSATGLPKRVIKTGFFVRRTRSTTARQVALNFDMAIFSMLKCQIKSVPWSMTIVQLLLFYLVCLFRFHSSIACIFSFSFFSKP